ncbi:hypothetical protein LA345_38990 (plasmid) [Burkholderia vietnamiensis]|uniref:Uncharacterized protein n=1 Tax=Burkholderia vietnamiensis (strain G4 / LMG 22486) TaxID=269482 RepID=A4JWF8_BURVG|nr:hypothetical protein Bcep1808_7741 [Burkholderia vietnamiensis G4]MCB4349786.1 hypothetical protein [Burkholderia vietnamiensis]
MTQKTPNGIDLLTHVTGLTKEDVTAIHAKAEANRSRLESCARHAFEPVEPGKLFSRHRCTHCGGEADSVGAHWYARGLAHGGAA